MRKSVTLAGLFLFLLTAVLIALPGCLLFINYDYITIQGYLRSANDSTAVPGAFLVFRELSSEGSYDRYSDSHGYFKQIWTLDSGPDDPIRLSVTAIDIDGENNGVFLPRDTLITVEGNSGFSLDATLHVDLYVEMVEVEQ